MELDSETLRIENEGQEMTQKSLEEKHKELKNEKHILEEICKGLHHSESCENDRSNPKRARCESDLGGSMPSYLVSYRSLTAGNGHSTEGQQLIVQAGRTGTKNHTNFCFKMQPWQQPKQQQQQQMQQQKIPNQQFFQQQQRQNKQPLQQQQPNMQPMQQQQQNLLPMVQKNCATATSNMLQQPQQTQQHQQPHQHSLLAGAETTAFNALPQQDQLITDVPPLSITANNFTQADMSSGYILKEEGDLTINFPGKVASDALNYTEKQNGMSFTSPIQNATPVLSPLNEYSKFTCTKDFLEDSYNMPNLDSAELEDLLEAIGDIRKKPLSSQNDQTQNILPDQNCKKAFDKHAHSETEARHKTTGQININQLGRSVGHRQVTQYEACFRQELSKSQDTLSELSKSQNTSTEMSKSQDTSSELSKSQDTSSVMSKSQDTSSKLSKSQNTSTELSKPQGTGSELSKSQNTSTEMSKSQDTSSELPKSQETSSVISKSQNTISDLPKPPDSISELSKPQDINSELSRKLDIYSEFKQSDKISELSKLQDITSKLFQLKDSNFEHPKSCDMFELSAKEATNATMYEHNVKHLTESMQTIGINDAER